MIYGKISLLNDTTIRCINEPDENKVIKAFTDAAIRILDASFGFVWFNTALSREFKLVYKSPATPYTPKSPHKGGRNYHVIESRMPDYVTQVKKRHDKYDVSKYMRSFVIIPICHREVAYGNIVLCFKKTELFEREKKILCQFIGNSVADAITIHRLLKSEQERSKTEFITEAAHDLRTPLAIIKGTIDLALRSKNKKAGEYVEALRQVEVEVNHLSELVTDLSLLAKLDEASKTSILRHDIRLDTLIHRVAKRLSPLASKKHITLIMKDLCPVIVRGDEFYLEKMFENIVKNAVSYGKTGGRIELSGSAKKRVAEIAIRDNGIGIPKHDLPRIFERFYRGAEARAINHDGSGLGLAIVKWIAEAHDGVVKVSSQVNKGTTFKVEFTI